MEQLLKLSDRLQVRSVLSKNKLLNQLLNIYSSQAEQLRIISTLNRIFVNLTCVANMRTHDTLA